MHILGQPQHTYFYPYTNFVDFETHNELWLPIEIKRHYLRNLYIFKLRKLDSFRKVDVIPIGFQSFFSSFGEHVYQSFIFY